MPLLLFARAAAAADPVLRPDLPGEVSAAYAGTDPLLDSLCQFDLLVTVASGVAADVTDERALLTVSYPNYARVNGGRAQPDRPPAGPRLPGPPGAVGWYWRPSASGRS